MTGKLCIIQPPSQLGAHAHSSSPGSAEHTRLLVVSGIQGGAAHQGSQCPGTSLPQAPLWLWFTLSSGHPPDNCLEACPLPWTSIYTLVYLAEQGWMVEIPGPRWSCPFPTTPSPSPSRTSHHCKHTPPPLHIQLAQCPESRPDSEEVVWGLGLLVW